MAAHGTPLAWNEYAAFGALRFAGAASGAPTMPYGFTGQYRDAATGLYHLRARQYDPTTGRFLSTDPVSPSIGDAYVASYVYANNGPLRYTDPSGRWTVGVCLSVNLNFLGFGGDFSACVVAASGLEVGVTVSGGGGGAFSPVPVGGSAGLVAQVSNGDYVEDLAGPFYNVGGSGGAGGGVQGSGFGGLGQCGQPVGGFTFGPILTTPRLGAYGTATRTNVLGTFGAVPPPCASPGDGLGAPPFTK